MKNPTKAAALAAALLLAMTLSACGDDTAAPSGGSTSTQARTQSNESETPEPLVAEAPAASDEDEKFLTYVRANLLPETQIPDASDEQLISAGHDACAQLDAGTALEDVRVVEGETPHENGNYYDTSAIMNGAITAYCPQYL